MSRREMRGERCEILEHARAGGQLTFVVRPRAFAGQHEHGLCAGRRGRFQGDSFGYSI